MTTSSRRIAWTAIVFTLFIALGMLAAQARAFSSNSSVAQSGPDRSDLATPIGAAVGVLTGPHPERALSALGVDPRVVLGYEPVIIDGSPARSDGGCSAPVPLPARFEPLCKIHDLGYDLLRAAARSGHPLGPWARQRLDRDLVDAMHRSCTNPICALAADVADIGLTVNTWRQHGGDPIGHEGAGDIVMSVVVRSAQAVIR